MPTSSQSLAVRESDFMARGIGPGFFVKCLAANSLTAVIVLQKQGFSRDLFWRLKNTFFKGISAPQKLP